MFEQKVYQGNNSESVENNQEKQKNEILEHIKGIESQGNSIGSGRTAEVFYSESDPSVCYKIINSTELYFNDVSKESTFLSEVLEIKNPEVRCPKPHYSLMVENGKGRYHVLVMERLDAVSIDDLLTGKEENIPRGFDFKDFFKKIESFLEKMHRAGIYHRDFHAGNIMIERGTGQPCVIDFGTAKKNIINSEDPYKKVDKNGKTIIFPDGFNEMQRVRIQMRDYILKKRKMEQGIDKN